jgi:AraC-like DNA-binding protein
MLNKKTIGILMALMPLVTLAAEQKDSCERIKIVPERLPDLNIPRYSNHVVFCQNGELTIFGGHTTGFVLTPTAEYYKDGEWHLIPMTYNHDFGLCVRLTSGKVLLGGGAIQNLGIGQSFETEVYNPVTHTFGKYGCLERKRFHSAGIELDGGRVVIAGNWYTRNGIEIYDTLHNTFTFFKEEAEPRSHPYILRTAKDDAIIFSCVGERVDTIFSPIVNRLKGRPFTVPLFETWIPLYPHSDFLSDNSFIGDESRGEYAYLMPVTNKEGQVAIAQVRDTVFTLLPTICPIPSESPWGRILWFGSILVDRKAQRGYLMGKDPDCRQFILAIDYAGAVGEGISAKLTLYYTDPMPDTGCILPVISPEGDLYIVGGCNANSNFFNPLGSVLLYRFGGHPEVPETAATGLPLWQWTAAVILVAIALAIILVLRKRRKNIATLPEASVIQQPSNSPTIDEELMHRITELMEVDRMFLNSDLKMSDVAARLGVHQNTVSSCINSITGSSFPQYVNRYRIDYAKQQILCHPEKKMTMIAMESGFTSDTSFLRTFRLIVGMTPKEWLLQQTTDKL